MTTNQNTSESALKSNVSSVGRGLLSHWTGLLKAETFVACTAQAFTAKNASDCSLTVLNKPSNGEPTMRKICSQKIESVIRKSLLNDKPNEESTGWSELDCNAGFQDRPQEVAKC